MIKVVANTQLQKCTKELKVQLTDKTKNTPSY